MNKILNLVGDYLNPQIEHELEARFNDGYEVLVHGIDGSKTVYNNVSEVHWRYENREWVAIESDIHHTGITMPIAKIESMHIRYAWSRQTEF
jgi:hypothetical protein